jgi:branched-chain amino acid transport system ATP-binding protein
VRDNLLLAVQAQAGSSFRFWRGATASTRCEERARGAGAARRAWPRFSSAAGTFAHGLQKRLDLALALATRPRLLLLDEPHGRHGTGGFAADGRPDRGLARRDRMLLIEHDMDAVFQLADRISVLVYGRVHRDGRRRHIRGHRRGAAAYLGDEVAVHDA